MTAGERTEGAPGAVAPGGQRIIRAATAGTGVFVAAATAAALAPDPLARPVAAIDVALFVVGLGAFVVAYGTAVARSRTDELSVAGVFFLSGAAPSEVRGPLLGALAVQVVVAFVTAGVRLYTPLAIGVLVPLFGLGLAGLWGARYGEFPPRAPRER